MGGLQQRTGLGRTTVSQALNGQVMPTEATLAALAKALGTDVGPMLALREAAVGIPRGRAGFAGEVAHRSVRPVTADGCSCAGSPAAAGSSRCDRRCRSIGAGPRPRSCPS
ncbi:helix-turn-helix domain-containing protein [Streptomyces sp. NPDC086989]|uniref:helix-turn-helix domain-containing protein n=1 Tax=Streptomyces sp. NPDC086989 TaxID=3365764 RepID=UPI0038291DAB